jgi:hypothetical protein
MLSGVPLKQKTHSLRVGWLEILLALSAKPLAPDSGDTPESVSKRAVEGEEHEFLVYNASSRNQVHFGLV